MILRKILGKCAKGAHFKLFINVKKHDRKKEHDDFRMQESRLCRNLLGKLKKKG